MKFQFNKTQKRIIWSGLSVIALSLILWQIFGGDIFTKTEVLIEVKDELFDMTRKEWKQQFVWGLDLSGAISGITIFITAVLVFFFRTKRKA